MTKLIDKIFENLGVDLLDEFDRNFERKAFFNKPWKKRKIEYGRGSLMSVTNSLRRSFSSDVSGNKLRFFSHAPQAEIFNEGGKIKITPQMRRFFWAMHYKYSSAKKQKNSIQTNDLASFYKNLALTKREEINIPRRQMIGDHPTVRNTVHNAAARATEKYCRDAVEVSFKKNLKTL